MCEILPSSLLFLVFDFLPTYLLGNGRLVISLHIPKLSKSQAFGWLWSVKCDAFGALHLGGLFGMCILRSPRVTSEGRESAVADPQRLASVVNEVLLSPALATHQVYSWRFSDPGLSLKGARSGRITFLLSPLCLGVKTNIWAGIWGKMS